ncbi:MAG TPA: hypothetical protein VN039_15515 [Nitrospira sp.]|nr:hypothetical protein [Nitrospira sp.]
MMGLTGHRLANKASTGTVTAPQNLVKVVFPQKTVVHSMQLIDSMGRPTYRKDIHV